ncbi:UDP-glucuronosyltransferase 2B13-like isoform X2 [Lytechinus variegatus]|uniref:UDP-glucuronosyltransferase 2B13-like isoform X2 n=1 Tax=Lytechinus variegatus TaxID=7654 RepID=UPI001BB28B7E|nr:UDP-glucuronosyltransferase 2B13-like isoform X2 [Lytechinus variegatus]
MVLVPVWMWSWVGLFFLGKISSVGASNILISSLYGEGSHFLLGASIGQGLVDNGHNVTCLISRAFEHRTSDPKYTNLSFEVFDHHDRSLKEVRDMFYQFNTKAMEGVQDQLMDTVTRFVRTLTKDCEAILKNGILMKRLEKMDAIVMDITWPCGLMIKEMIEQNLNWTRNLTMVSVSPTPPQAIFLYLIGSAYNPSYQPELMSGITNKMTFFQRVSNFLQTAQFMILAHLFTGPFYSDVAKNVGLNPDSADFYNWHKRIDLSLLSMDFSSEFPFPLAPNIIPVGGLTASPGRELDQELEDFMQSSGDDGVILFTLGTYFSAVAKLTPGFVEMFADAFGRLPQKVIWQLVDPPNDLELPSNIKLMPWVPQNDLLGHPKTRVFMYQGGNNGFQEACYHGVPIAIIPLYGDQYDVAARVVGRGMGRKLDKNNLNAEVIYGILKDLINDPKYRNVAKHVSAVNRNNPMTARERAAFWIDHVIKYGGDYLRSPAGELPFVVYHSLDVVAFIFSIICLLLAFISYTLLLCLRSCRRIVFNTNNKEKGD